MRVFLSLPMKNQNVDTILKNVNILKAVAKAYFQEEETIDFSCGLEAPTPSEDVKISSMFYLGNSIKLMSECDAILIPSPSMLEEWRGCYVEAVTAAKYGLKIHEYDVSILDLTVEKGDLKENVQQEV